MVKKLRCWRELKGFDKGDAVASFHNKSKNSYVGVVDNNRLYKKDNRFAVQLENANTGGTKHLFENQHKKVALNFLNRYVKKHDKC